MSKKKFKKGERVLVVHDYAPEHADRSAGRDGQEATYVSPNRDDDGSAFYDFYPNVVRFDDGALSHVNKVKKLKSPPKPGDRVIVTHDYRPGAAAVREFDRSGQEATYIRKSDTIAYFYPHWVKFDDGFETMVHKVKKLKVYKATVTAVQWFDPASDPPFYLPSDASGHMHWDGCYFEDVRS
jgi:hypothetical protein